ncbi:MAG TPA: histidine phosphatase family protein [Patescibacteria group bacterium]
MSRSREIVRTATVCTYLFRHGETPTLPDGKREDRLTPRGERQAALAGMTHLKNLQVLGILSSGTRRSTETIRTACTAAGMEVPGVEVVAAIGFSWIDDQVPPCDFYAIERRLHEEYGGSRRVPIYAWLEAYPHAQATRGRLTEFLHHRAKQEFMEWPLHSMINLVGGSHGPTAATAALNTRETMGLDFADGIRYDVEVVRYDTDEIETKLVRSRVLTCPDCK